MSQQTLTAIIGGTGLTQYPGLEIEREELIDTPLGAPSAPLIFASLHGEPVVFIARHGHPHTFPPNKINYRANMLALQQVGVTHIIAVNAVGGISAAMGAEAICIPDQIIDYTFGREDTYFDGVFKPLQHVDFSYPYDSGLRDALFAAAKRSAEEVQMGGVYAATQGPRLETAAEIIRLEKDGCHVVGMTGMPEAVLARELNIPYASLALVVNRAAGKSEGLITMDDIYQALEQGVSKVQKIISAYLQTC
ncbi:MAG: S-methyl-5'-thioinosine phosphorylase [Bermanella sp.]